MSGTSTSTSTFRGFKHTSPYNGKHFDPIANDTLLLSESVPEWTPLLAWTLAPYSSQAQTLNLKISARVAKLLPYFGPLSVLVLISQLAHSANAEPILESVGNATLGSPVHVSPIPNSFIALVGCLISPLWYYPFFYLVFPILRLIVMGLGVVSRLLMLEGWIWIIFILFIVFRVGVANYILMPLVLLAVLLYQFLVRGVVLVDKTIFGGKGINKVVNLVIWCAVTLAERGGIAIFYTRCAGIIYAGEAVRVFHTLCVGVGYVGEAVWRWVGPPAVLHYLSLLWNSAAIHLFVLWIKKTTCSPRCLFMLGVGLGLLNWVLLTWASWGKGSVIVKGPSFFKGPSTEPKVVRISIK